MDDVLPDEEDAEAHHEIAEQHLLPNPLDGSEAEAGGRAVHDSIHRAVELVESSRVAVGDERGHAGGDRDEAAELLGARFEDDPERGTPGGEAGQDDRHPGAQGEEEEHGPERLLFVHVDEADHDQVEDRHQKRRH